MHEVLLQYKTTALVGRWYENKKTAQEKSLLRLKEPGASLRDARGLVLHE